MLLHIVLVAALASAGTQSPGTGPLREIGGQHSASVCGNLVVHANSAISAALRNDATVARSIARLRNVDLENNELSKRSGAADLGRLASDLQQTSLRGDEELGRLRNLAENSGDETAKAELKTFSGALSGALLLQRSMALDLNSLLSLLEVREIRGLPGNVVPGSPGTGRSLFQTNPGGQAIESVLEHRSLNAMAQATALSFESRVAEVQADEAKAAEHSENAVSGCP